MKILITGGAGFIGSHLVRLFVNKYPNYIKLVKPTQATPRPSVVAPEATV